MTKDVRGLGQGAFVALDLSARVFGLRLLRLQGHLVLTPTQSRPTGGLGGARGERALVGSGSSAPRPSAPAPPSVERSPTASLYRARRLVQESERSLVQTRGSDPGPTAL